MSKTLDVVIEEILSLSKKPLSVNEITTIIHDERLWLTDNDEPPKRNQVSARISNRKDKFLRQSGVVRLKSAKDNEQRIARLSHNTNNWVLPSGFEGKSKSRESYEFKNGYAHEEWLLDLDKTIDGYHYGFLQPINKNYYKYIGNVFDIYLFTVNSYTNERFWVGKLNNVEIIDEETSDKVKSVYLKNGWIKEMEQDLETQGLDGSKIGKKKGVHLFNLRFKPEDFEKYPNETLIQKDDRSISSYHYILLHVTNTPKIETEADGEFVLGRCNPNRRFAGKKVKKKIEERLVEYPFLHTEISKGLEKILKKTYDKVYPEHDTGFKTSIDLVAVKSKKVHFFEIKTYADVRTCIRQALGQLLEYAYYPDKHLADKLFIVTPHKVKDEKLVAYIKNLRESIGLSIGYMAYDLDSARITQTV